MTGSIRRCCLLLIAGSLLQPACARQGETGERQRIVLITLDTLRYDSFRRAGPATDMPRTSAYAARGSVFTRYYAASPMTQPTHASLFTGLQPWEHAVLINGDRLGERHLTLVERLQQNGFETAAVVASFPLDARFGFAQGFDHYVADFREDYGVDAWANQEVAGRFYSRAETIVDEALRRLEASTAPRQFFWFHLFDPHEPYGDTQGVSYRIWQLERLKREGSPRLAPSIELARKLYDLDVQHLDLLLDRIFRRLDDEAGLWETHVVVVSDHGESFGEDGVFGHGTTVSAEQVHVPLFVVSPALEPELRRDVVGSVDVAATLLSLAGIDHPDLAGRDLSRPSSPAAGSAAGLGFEDEEGGPTGARFFVVRDGVHYAERAGGVFRNGRLARPVEEDVVAGIQEVFAGLKERLRGVRVERLADDETVRGLRALGYLAADPVSTPQP